MKRTPIILGADIKLKVSLKALGEDVKLDEISYKLTFTAGSKSKVFNITLAGTTQTLPTGVTKVDSDNVLVSLVTSDLDRGDLFLLAEAFVPDTSFADGNRKEVVNHDTLITIE